MRIGSGALRRLADADAFHQFHRAVPGLAAADALVDQEDLGDLRAHRAPGLSAVIGSWNTMAMSLPRNASRSRSVAQQVAAIEAQLVGADAAGRIDQPHQRKAGDRFSRARLADQAHDLAAPHAQVHARTACRGVAAIETDGQVAHGEQRVGVVAHRRNSD